MPRAQHQTDLSNDRRYAVRRPLRLATSLSSSDAGAMIRDLSVTGVLLETDLEVSIDDPLLVEIPNLGYIRALIVWNSGRFVGCKFEEPISAVAVRGAFLKGPFLKDLSAGSAGSELCVAGPTFQIDGAENNELPFVTRLVIALVVGVAVSAPIACIPALLA